MIGLARGEVALLDHDREWETEAERTKARLGKILGGVCRAIEHVGSTSVPTIKAKPIIDIAVGVDSLKSVLALEKDLAADGFYYRHAIDNRGNTLPNLRELNDDIEQILFACGDYYTGGKLQTHFIHVVRYGGKMWNDYIAFRDTLRNNPDIAREYERLKISLERSTGDRYAYTDGKHEFVEKVLESVRKV